MLFVAENFNEGLKDNIDWGEGYYTGGRDRYYVYYAKKVPFQGGVSDSFVRHSVQVSCAEA